MAEYPMRFGRSSPEWSEQQRTEIAPVGPENLRVAHLNMLDQKSRAKRPLAASQTKAQRKQAKQERKKATSSRKKKANMRLTKGNQTLVPATDEERVTNLELAIFHVFANKQLALDALDVRDKRSSTYRLAIVGDLLLLLAPADKWMETSLTAGQWTKLRGSIEKNAQLAKHCVNNGLHKLALGCIGATSTHQLGTIVEAVLAAVYYDTNKSLDAVRGVMRSLQIMDTVDAHLHRKNVTVHTTKARKGQTKWKRSKAVTSPPGGGEVVTVEISDDEDVNVMMDDWEDEDGHENSEQEYERSTAQLEKEVAAELRQLLV